VAKLTVINACCGPRLRVVGCSGPLVLADEDDPCCCNEFEYTIEMCNVNSITDDDWEVYLNDKSIGAHKAPEMKLAGTVWSTSDEVEGESCGDVTKESVKKDDFEEGENTLRIKITKENGFGNFGTVTVRKWKFDFEADKFVVDSVLFSGTYTANGTGAEQSFPFNYP